MLLVRWRQLTHGSLSFDLQPCAILYRDRLAGWLWTVVYG